MKDTATKQKFIELRAEGISYEKIARELKVSKLTLINWSKGLQRDIGNLKAIKLETLQESFCIAKRQRIELLGGHLDRLKEELTSRDLKDISTTRLLELILKFDTALQQESVPLTFTENEELLSFDGPVKQLVSWKG